MPTSRRRTRVRTLLITGISGRMGRLLARRLHKQYRIIGIDRRGPRHLPRDVTVHGYDLRRRAAEDVFRRERVDAVVHLNLLHDPRRRAAERHAYNVQGTHKLLEYCVNHGVTQLVLLSSANVYGANPNNHQFLNEESPLNAAAKFTSMRDLVEIDIYTNSFFWRHPEVDTVILRPVHIVGHVNNAISNYLRMKYPPTVMGFDPMLQIIHVDDVVEAIVASLRPGVRGVFNIVGPGAIALSVLQRQLGRRKLPLPDPLLRPVTQVLHDLKLSGFRAPELDFLKYVCMVDGSRAQDVLKFEAKKTLRETIEAVRY